MLKNLPGIGLDIGSRLIKIAWVRPHKAGWRIIKQGSMETPQGIVEAGVIKDPESLGKQIGVLVKNMKIQGKRVTTAVSGSQIYLRNVIMPYLNWQELREAVYYQAYSFLPIPVEEAALDIYPLRDYVDDEGRKIELFFAAVPKQQVDDIATVIKSAKLRPAVVEVEPLALWRAWGADSTRVAALLTIGAARSYFTVFNRGIPVFYRSITVPVEEVHKVLEQDNRPVMFAENNSAGKLRCKELFNGLLSEVKTARDYYQMQAGSEEGRIEKLILCGGGVWPVLPIVIAEDMNIKVELMTDRVEQQFILPASTSTAERLVIQKDFPLALGLAMRR